jgi:hypothetical protein
VPYGIIAANDPVNKIDPTGEFTADFSLIGLNISISIHSDVRGIQGIQGRAFMFKAARKIGDLGRLSVKEMRKWKKAGEETHHLLEKRMLRKKVNGRELGDIMKERGFGPDDMPGVNLQEGTHQGFTNLWRAKFPYEGQAGYSEAVKIPELIEAIEQIYASQPAWVRVLTEFLMPI